MTLLSSCIFCVFQSPSGESCNSSYVVLSFVYIFKFYCTLDMKLNYLVFLFLLDNKRGKNGSYEILLCATGVKTHINWLEIKVTAKAKLTYFEYNTICFSNYLVESLSIFWHGFCRYDYSGYGQSTGKVRF